MSQPAISVFEIDEFNRLIDENYVCFINMVLVTWRAYFAFISQEHCSDKCIKEYL